MPARSFSAIVATLPVTLLLILGCCAVGLKTRLGSQPGNADALFLASKKHSAEYQEAYDTYELAADALPDSVAPSQAAAEEIERLVEKVRVAERDFTNPLADVKKGQVWRLFTPIFLHFGIIHLLFNMMWLWTFGGMLERRFGPWRFLGLVLAVALISNVTQGYWGGINFGGMSGANYGLFGFLYLRGKFHPNPGSVLSGQTIQNMLVWLAICFTGLVGPIANGAHVGGLIAGGLIGLGAAVLGGGWQVFKRRQQFRSSLRSSADSLHRCEACKKTEQDSPELTFYVSTTDQLEYCSSHLPEKKAQAL
jgi:membrane associated rhomboid family serine protease